MTDGLYVDPETGRTISTHSMLKTFRRCPKQAEYKYVERLKPRILGRPLRLGTWMHELQEAKGKGEDWKEKHQELIDTRWNKLFDEEKEDIGDLPGDAFRLMTSYEWYYKADEWIFHEIEFVLEAELPDGSLYRGKIDALVENAFGLWIVDRKWHKTLPNTDYRILDSQSALYVWAARKNKIPVLGHMWDYGRSKPPTWPAMLKSGKGPARWAACDTDYPTMVKWFKQNMGGKVPEHCKPKMRYLKTLQYQQGTPQHSAFFRRSVIEKSDAMLKRVAQEAYHTHKRMNEYPWDRPELTERVPDRSCSYMCSYTDLCTAELFTGGRPVNWKSIYKQGDPMDYYFDEAPTREDK